MKKVIMPGFRKMNLAPKIALTRFGAGVHSFWKTEKDLPVGHSTISAKKLE